MNRTRNHFTARHHAFTLTELLIVIGLMVIILAMGVPMFRFITGSHSVDGAINQIKAELSRARAEAIAGSVSSGSGTNVGVAFYYDSYADRYAMALVHPVGVDTTVAGASDLDFTADTDFQYLPTGIACFAITNSAGGGVVANAGSYARTADGYVHIGVIMYDSRGRLVTTTYRVLNTSNFAAKAGGSQIPATATALTTQIGFVLFNEENYKNQPVFGPTWTTSGPSSVAINGGTYATSDAARDIWLDNNAQPCLVDRYSGSILEVPNL